MMFIKKSIFAMAAFALVFTSCQKEESINQAPKEVAEWDYTDNGKIIEGQYIVVFHKEAVTTMKSSVSYKEKKQLMKSEIQTLFPNKSFNIDAIEHIYVETFYGFAGKLTEDQLLQLRNSDKIDYIEEDKVIMLGKPPWAGGGGGGGSTGQEVPWGISRVGYGDGTGKTAWILDTGIDLDHPDLNVDQNNGYSVFTKGKDATPNDGNGHGSHVAGTIAALDNDQGVVGVAAGALVVPVKVLNSRGSGSYSGVIDGIDYVAANASNGDVANMSLGGPISDALDQAVLAAAQSGVIFALAAGNESDNANDHSPARVNHNNIYTISAMDVNDDWAYFSNYANPPIDYCAPGVSIKSTWKDGGYNTISGTSMASPHAAGVLLLGAAHSDGSVNGDPDDKADPIIHN